MGYYTQYNLNVNVPPDAWAESAATDHWTASWNAQRGPTAAVRDVIAEFRAENESARYALLESGDTQSEAKWYSHQTDLEAFSLRYPKLLFILHGLGEEAGDEWVLYAQNGKSYKVTRGSWTPPPFDPAYLGR